MPLYDCMLLLKPKVTKEAVADLLSRIGRHVYTRNGVLTEVKSFGTIQLGYGIKKLDGRYFQGQLMQMTMMATPNINKELHYLNKEDRLLRWLLVKHRDTKYGMDFISEDDGKWDLSEVSSGSWCFSSESSYLCSAWILSVQKIDGALRSYLSNLACQCVSHLAETKQPSNAPIYYPRPLSKQNRPIFPPFSLSRFIVPSFSWIPRAFRVSEDEILDISGLDALVVIRLFKFGINFFSVSSVVGLLILLPINYAGQDDPSAADRCLDSCTISNIKRGSNRLWVHFICLWLISIYGLYLLYREYSVILVRRIQRMRIMRNRPDQFTTLVRQIPICNEHKARGCCVDHFFSKHHPYSYHSYQMLYDGKDIEHLLDQARYIQKKVHDLRERRTVKKSIGEMLLWDKRRDDAEKASLLEEKLQELFHKIHHLQSEEMLKTKELPVAFVTFKSRWGAALAAQTQQHTNPLLWITETAPEPNDVSWRNLAIQYRFLLLHKIGVILAASLLTVFFAVPVTAVQGIAKFEKLKKWFPPVKAIELIPGLSSVVTGYLPSAILKGFLYIVPFAVLAMCKVGGSISKSKEEIKACNMADFFMTYILTDGLSGFSLEILQPGLLLWDLIKSHTFNRGKEKELYLYSLPYFRIIPTVALSILIGIVYAVIAPLLLPFLIVYFFLGYAVYINQIQDVYETVYDTYGQFWPFIHHYIFVAIILMQITMIGLFGLKSKPAASIATIPLVLLTIMFNEYCKIRFLPAFQRYSIQNAVENDEVDEENGQMEGSYEKAVGVYRQPSLRQVKFTQSGSNMTQPLITSL
ncbi:Ribosomal protein S6 [Corchorus olitorius]|uniref:Ribosomal protein S6 n=1 Tax=Corchorus olitorius TaxID=93759 RepID=A0A1R3GGV0_9ROSI|nr:Ribosomal protein S6 [Corchorus olitorius]